ncbi:MAG: nucleotidyltransferase [Pseudanabaena frigida]|uniref:Nucleotidyltransferase n=1 Tax=Pseudanabaena frigida TaxID=945775 RepID=A0A2W4WF33_9CYAN|nr:MAG: nucleotidyltransferase [Pseudanabaena frigida]
MITNSLDRDYILNELRGLKLELRDRYKVTKIGVFGSVARNEATEESDIDIVVEMEPNMLKRVGLKQELEKLFNKEVDVIRYRTSMNPYLKSQIDREAIYA